MKTLVSLHGYHYIAPMPRRKKTDPMRGMYQRKGIWWISSDGRGHQIKAQSLGTRDPAVALVKAAAVRRDPILCSAGTLWGDAEDYIEDMVKRGEWREHSRVSKSTTLRTFCVFVRQTPADKLTVPLLQEYYDFLKEPHIPNPVLIAKAKAKRPKVGLPPKEKVRCAETINSYMTIISSFLTWCVLEGKCRENLARLVKRVKSTRPAREDWCTKTQRDLLIDNCTDPELKLILFLGFRCGMRKEEIIMAKPDWFDLERKTITLRETPTMQFKGRKGRTIPLDKVFLAYLKTITLASPYIIAPESDSKGEYRYDFERKFKHYCKSQGVPITPHIMRHTFASLKVQGKVSMFKVAKWLGDLERTVERHYAKLAAYDPDIDADE